MVNDNIFKRISNRIRELRLQIKPKMTQEDLANKLGHHYSYISKIEGGKRIPSLYDTERLEDIFHAKGQLVPYVREYLNRKTKVKIDFKETAERIITSGEILEHDIRPMTRKVEMVPHLNSVKSKSKKWDNPAIIDRWIPIPDSFKTGRNMYAIVAHDNSLDKRDNIDKGTTLIVDPDLKPHQGKVVVVSRGGGYLIRIYSKKRSKITLRAESTSAHQDVVLTSSEFNSYFRGVAVAMQKKLS